MEPFLSHLPLSFLLLQSLSCGQRPITIICPPILHRFLYYRPCLHLSIRLLQEQDRSKTNRGGEWMDSEAHGEEDSLQQTKDEPSEQYKQNQQEAWISG